MATSARPTLRRAAPGKRARASAPNPTVAVLVATRKGAWIFHADPSRRSWRADGPHFLGHVIHHLVLDPRDGRTLLAAAKTGHLGPTIFRSTDLGKTWKEAKQPPAFTKKADGSGRSVDHTFWLTPGHASEPGVWYAGTSPQGLFRSDDGGVTWSSASPINDDPQYIEWMGTVQDGTPDGPKMHSIIVDPRDPKHLYFGMSGGGVHESTDGGRTFRVADRRARGRRGLLARRAHVPRPALHPALPEQPGPPLPAEPLRHLSHRPAVEHLGAHRQGDAEEGRRRRLHDGRASARRQRRVGAADGRHHRVAAHQPGRRTGGLRHAQRRQDVAAPGRRPAARSRRGGP